MRRGRKKQNYGVDEVDDANTNLLFDADGHIRTDVMQIVGLVVNADPNGQFAIRQQFDPSAKRWYVKVEGVEEVVRIKSENLRKPKGRGDTADRNQSTMPIPNQ